MKRPHFSTTPFFYNHYYLSIEVNNTHSIKNIPNKGINTNKAPPTEVQHGGCTTEVQHSGKPANLYVVLYKGLPPANPITPPPAPTFTLSIKTNDG